MLIIKQWLLMIKQLSLPESLLDPQTDAYLMTQRPGVTSGLAGTFDLVSRAQVRVSASTAVFCNGPTIMSNGDIVLMGGTQYGFSSIRNPDGRYSIQTYTAGGTSTNLVSNMTSPRWWDLIYHFINKLLCAAQMPWKQASKKVSNYVNIWFFLLWR